MNEPLGQLFFELETVRRIVSDMIGRSRSAPVSEVRKARDFFQREFVEPLSDELARREREG